MSLEDDLDHAGGPLKDAVRHGSDAGEKVAKKIVDAGHEAAHHAAAEEERDKRELLDDRLSVGAKVKSVMEEAKHRVQENVSGVKKRLDGL